MILAAVGWYYPNLWYLPSYYALYLLLSSASEDLLPFSYAFHLLLSYAFHLLLSYACVHLAPPSPISEDLHLI